jgi:diguanylate cyclase (GGDEF)-like protein
MSLLLVQGEQPPALEVCNNNSVCAAFQSSRLHSHLCEPFCGQAFKNATEAGAAIAYRCHAGLSCVAVPVTLERENFAVIGGRAFLRSADYRAVAERIRVGDLSDLLSPELFSNVIFASRNDLDDLARRIERLAGEFARSHEQGREREPSEGQSQETHKSTERSQEEGETPGWNSSISHHEAEACLSDHSAEDQLAGLSAYALAAENFVDRYGISSMLLLRLTEKSNVVVYSRGRFGELAGKRGISTEFLQLTQAGESTLPFFVLSDRAATGSLDPKSLKVFSSESEVMMFPVREGELVLGALLISDMQPTEEQRTAIVQFCRDLVTPFAAQRIVDELGARARFAEVVQEFARHIDATTPTEAYRTILMQSAGILQSSRSSLLVLDPSTNELKVRAAEGMREGVEGETRIKLGEGIAGSVLKEGKPLVVQDVDAFGYGAAHAARNYKSKSFISYPITISGRRVAVLNVTDKKDGGAYTEFHLGILDTLGPQMAIALDRAEWQEKAAQFQIMSITDPLTGLLNRRYLEERLEEEVNRSRRNGTAMSFIMLDIDDFKRYNDRNGHQAGDDALETTAQCLKSVLRSEDVAARYGGEEFSILLPQTDIDEARIIAERLRSKIRSTEYRFGGEQPLGAVTVSIGVSGFTKNLDHSVAIIGAADRAMYVAKSLGKNRVHVDEESYLAFVTSEISRNAK